jgi:5-formyltetrahydrofolate cyclo-ligase
MIDLKKKEIRNHIKEIKKNFSFEDKKARSKKIFEKIEKLPEFINAKILMAYWSMDDEVNTHDFILKCYPSKRIILPSVKGDELELREFTGIQDMSKGSAFGISEPNHHFTESFNLIDFIIVPGVAFDNKNNRLGRGKAYYDKLLKGSKAFMCGVCFNYQIIDTVPTSDYDIKMDLVITD